MFAGVLIAAKKSEKNIGEKIFDLSRAVFEEINFEFHSSSK